MSKYGVFSCPYFPTFGLNTERYGVRIREIRIQSKCRKIRTRKNSVFGHFSRSESFEHYDEGLVSLIDKWNEIQNYHAKIDLPGKHVTYFMKFKAELLRSKVAKPIRDGAGYKGDYTQIYIEWVNFLSKNEIDAADKNCHKCVTIHEAIGRLKDRFLRLCRDAVKALHGESKY